MKILAYLLAAMLLFSPLIWGSESKEKAEGKHKSQSAQKSAGKHKSGGAAKAHWGYEGPEGPQNWGGLDPNYALCNEGLKQSPIDFRDTNGDEAGKIVFSYRDTKLNVLNNGHTVQVNYRAGSVLTLNGEKYLLAQFHFHSPSEHKVGGRPYDMEMHLVHLNRKKELAVVAVLLKEGRHSNVLEEIWRRMPEEANVKNEVDGVKINAADLLPADKSRYNYSGSLTTPPCSEGVKWTVLKTPIEVSREQIGKFVSVIGENARPVQPINQRSIANSR
ncbi:MAG: carbonic anhydrase family protein [SAR324 cluster bacterium]|nr:carbonic anhydrase family protein [SAR324 cluster bacterium]